MTCDLRCCPGRQKLGMAFIISALSDVQAFNPAVLKSRVVQELPFNSESKTLSLSRNIIKMGYKTVLWPGLINPEFLVVP